MDISDMFDDDEDMERFSKQPPPRSEPAMLSDEQISRIVRDAATGAATRRDGTTSTRIARAIEAAAREQALQGVKPQIDQMLAAQIAEIDALREQLAAAEADTVSLIEDALCSGASKPLRDAIDLVMQGDRSALQSALAKAREDERERCIAACKSRYAATRKECPEHWKHYEKEWGLRNQIVDECMHAINATPAAPESAEKKS